MSAAPFDDRLNIVPGEHGAAGNGEEKDRFQPMLQKKIPGSRYSWSGDVPCFIRTVFWPPPSAKAHAHQHIL
jgi:hypothetical protein